MLQVTQDEFKERMNEYVRKRPEGMDILKSAALQRYMGSHVGEKPSGAKALSAGPSTATTALSDDEMDKIFNAFDANGDGVLEVSELIHFIKVQYDSSSESHTDTSLSRS